MLQLALIPLGISRIQGMLAPHLHSQFHGVFQWDKGQWDLTVLTQKFPGASSGAPGVPVAAGDRKTWN